MGSRGATLPLRGAGAAPLLGFRGKAPKRPSGRKYIKGTSKNYVFRGGGVGRSPTHSPFAFRRKAKGEVFRGAHKILKYSAVDCAITISSSIIKTL